MLATDLICTGVAAPQAASGRVSSLSAHRIFRRQTKTEKLQEALALVAARQRIRRTVLVNGDQCHTILRDVKIFVSVSEHDLESTSQIQAPCQGCISKEPAGNSLRTWCILSSPHLV